MSTLTIEFRDNNRIASEVVFLDEEIERTVANAFRFALKAYLYYKDYRLLDFSEKSGINHQTVARQLGATKSVTQAINHKMATDVCEHYNVPFEYLYVIAEQFVKNPEYNSISFKEDGTVIFLKAFKLRFGD